MNEAILIAQAEQAARICIFSMLRRYVPQVLLIASPPLLKSKVSCFFVGRVATGSALKGEEGARED